MGPPFEFPSPLYPIVDSLDSRRSHVVIAREMLEAGVRFLQLRVKNRGTGEFVAIARQVKRLADSVGAALIINDRADVAKLIDAAGVHLGQGDLPADEARALLGPDKIIGLSTHSLAQVELAVRTMPLDYLGYGPIFATTSKQNPDPVQGLEALRAVRGHTRVPLVAIGGITAETMPAVLAAGADAVAMIGEIVNAPIIGAKLRALGVRSS